MSMSRPSIGAERWEFSLLGISRPVIHSVASIAPQQIGQGLGGALQVIPHLFYDVAQSDVHSSGWLDASFL